MSLRKMFGTNSEKEKSGVRVDYGDFAVTLARAGKSNPSYVAAAERIFAPYQDQIKKGILDNDLGEKLMQELYADAVVLGWDGNIEARDGSNLDFCKNNIIRAFKEYPDFFSDVREKAEGMDLFRGDVPPSEEVSQD